MNKRDILNRLEDAIRSHIKWINRAKSILDGKSLVRDPHPIDDTSCQFGLWLHTQGKVLFEHMNQEEEYATIVEIHRKLHKKYLAIYEIYFGSFIGIQYDQKARLKKAIVALSIEDQARSHFEKLREHSYEMLAKLEQLKRAIHAKEDWS